MRRTRYILRWIDNDGWEIMISALPATMNGSSLSNCLRNRTRTGNFNILSVISSRSEREKSAKHRDLGELHYEIIKEMISKRRRIEIRNDNSNYESKFNDCIKEKTR